MLTMAVEDVLDGENGRSFLGRMRPRLVDR